jgi:hypothetical protein
MADRMSVLPGRTRLIYLLLAPLALLRRWRRRPGGWIAAGRGR